MAKMNDDRAMYGDDMVKKMEYRCPMHPEEVHNHPGYCSICGMELVPKSESMMNKTMYICSMHP
jgi:hypothetical protein